MFTTLIAITLSGSAVAAPEGAPAPAGPSKDRIICKSRPGLGSRINRTRICKTAEEWRIYANDLEQSRRENNDRGMNGDPNGE